MSTSPKGLARSYDRRLSVLDDDRAVGYYVADRLVRMGATISQLPVSLQQSARDALRKERLQLQFMRAITVEKKLEPSGWAKVTIEQFRDHVKNLVKHRRHARMLNVAMDRLFLSRRDTQITVKKTETTPARQHRLAEFWSVFHERVQKGVEEPLRKSSSRQGIRRPSSPAQMQAPLFDEPSSPSRPSSSYRPLSAKTQNWAFESPPLSSFVEALPKPISRGGSRGGQRKTAVLPSKQIPDTRIGSRKPSSLPSLRDGKSVRERDGSLQHPEDTTYTMVSMQRKYAFACSSAGVVPALIHFATGHSENINAAHCDLSDHELLAMVAAAKEAFVIEAVDLSHNAMLTDVSLVPLLQAVRCSRKNRSLQRLALASCSHLGVNGMDSVIGIVQEARALRSLDLSQTPLSAKARYRLCALIGGHGGLQTVNLAGVRLGEDCFAKHCVESLLGSVTLAHLDLGWNTFTPDVFNCIGECLATNRVLRQLCIPNCSMVVGDGETSVSHFLEQLSSASLRFLDISMNRIDGKAALLLEDSLGNNMSLREMDLSENPLGMFGMRSVLRLLALDSCSLTYFRSENCSGYGGGAEEGESSERHMLHVIDPGRRYVLDLSLPTHRSVLRMLYKIASQCGLSGEEALQSLSYSPTANGPRTFAHGTLAGGVWQVPTTGTLSATFGMERAMEKLESIEENDFAGFLQKHLALMRRRPGKKKVLALLSRFRQLEGHTRQQEIYLKALSKDFCLEMSSVDYLCSVNRSLEGEVTQRLLPCLSGKLAEIYHFNLSLNRLSLLLVMCGKVTRFLSFTPNNPTGHYCLDLNVCAEYAVAERLLMLDRWEMVLDRRTGAIDTSRWGNGAHTRNELYQSKPLVPTYPSLAEWRLPGFALFEVDYVSGRRPPLGATTVSSAALNRILRALYDSRCSSQEKVETLRNIASHIYVSCIQVRQLTRMFKDRAHHLDIFVLFLMRIVDHHNEKMVRVCYDSTMALTLCERLGYCTMSPFVQVENSSFDLNLAFHDQRLYASYIVQLSNREKPRNLQSPVYIREDGKVEPFTIGVPRSWESHDKLPKGGIFRGSYKCAPEDRQFGFRMKLGETYNRFRSRAEEADVLWWTGLEEPPADVIKVLEFFVAIFPDADKAFELIDGPSGTGRINKKTFVEALKGLQCAKFQGKDEEQRMEQVFRYIDSSGDGSVSAREWQFFNQLWAEFNLCVAEFTQFLSYTFSGKLEEAWRVIDMDGSDSLDLDEWCTAIYSVGFFGPASMIFALLDVNGNKRISLDEFMKLKDRL